MCNQSTYAHMLEQVRRRIDSGYSPESAHAAVAADWKAEHSDSCELYEDALDYATVTYGLTD